MNLERVPITRNEAEKSTNSSRSTALQDLGTRMTSLQTAAKNLGSATLFSGRTATSGTTGTTWQPTVASGAALGTNTFAVSRLATAARREGAADIGSGLNPTNDVSGVTIATMSTAAAVTAGEFTVNGARVAIATTDSLADVFTAIATATGGDVTAAYNAGTDKITLTSGGASEIVLGAANDTSNFLQAIKLVNNGTATVSSAATLGTARTSGPLASAGLKTAITAVDGAGAGSFSLNGVSIAYNVNTDSLSAVLKRINASTAGVTASFDAASDRVVLTNKATGDLGLTLGESAGGLLGALGLSTGHTTVRGVNAEFTVNGGPTLVSTGNTLDATTHGITGLSVTVTSETTQAITVAADTGAMKEKINAFITTYNTVQSFIDEKTKITSSKGKVTAGVLAANREVQDWARQLRGSAFAAVAGLSGTIDRVDDLGFSFDRDGRMSIGDPTKLDAALSGVPADVEEFFLKSTTGFSALFDRQLKSMISAGDESQARLTRNNTSLDDQIAALERRIVQQRELLTSSFIKMEEAQARIQQQSSAIANAFSTKQG